MKRIFCTAAAILISSAALMPIQAMAQNTVRVVTIEKAPPAPRREAVPAARRGYEWAPGYWNWNGRRHVWVAGHWERARKGHHYDRPEWRQGSNGWELNRGGWRAGDRDGDGVSNRNDRQPDNPNRN